MPADALEALFALATAGAEVSRFLEVQGLSFAELRLLLAIRAAADRGRRPTDLARELRLTPSGVTRALLPLEKRGIVTREADANDARASHVSLTAAGSTLLEQALVAAGERAAKLLRRLSVGQTKQLQRLLEEIGR
ncbi:MAG TPA: MarR family transcriptional regulator [Candidatus Baltobacteraceae bacterium]|nr:MarR family transcriptional regulator [Candidatus Baltobacteraceae bacterium]